MTDVFGVPVSDLPTNLSRLTFPPLCDTADHTVVTENCQCAVEPRTFPEVDDNVVLMPFLEGNQDPEETGYRRWESIKQSLGQELLSSSDVENAVQNYISGTLNYYWPGLHMYFREREFDKALLRWMADFALELPNICTRPISLLRRQKDSSVTVSQKQAACLLANAFFCTFPAPKLKYFIPLAFSGLFYKPSVKDMMFSKLDCVFNYFRRVMAEMPGGNITFHRQVSSF
jgi:hypothetical protein